MLAGQNFGRSHYARLIAIVQGDEGGHEGHDCFSATHVTLQQAVHLLAAAHIVPHLTDDALLRSSERELQDIVVKVMEIGPYSTEHMPHQSATAALDVMQDIEFQEKQFLELETELRLLQSLLVGGHVDIA